MSLYLPLLGLLLMPSEAADFWWRYEKTDVSHHDIRVLNCSRHCTLAMLEAACVDAGPSCGKFQREPPRAPKSHAL
jgi:hypothetical protein